VDLVIESAPEDMELKQQLFARMDALARPEAILASNTSGLSITQIASRCRHPERVLTTHFWNPPHLMPLVEIVRGAQTADDVVASVRQLLLDCGKTPVLVKKDRPGQLGNRLQHALWREALYIVAEGIADPEEVDLAAKTGFGLRLPVYGIFEHMDAVGLELAFAVLDYVARDLCSEPRAPAILPEMIRQGRLGARSGRGFYDWSQRDFNAVIRRRDEFLVEFLRSRFRQP
jgi:3-hydroxybutyryl-CoA dehydrogenase